MSVIPDYLPGHTAERFMCDVLEDMRNCCKYSNYSQLPYYIEEAQQIATRMENKLHNKRSYYELVKILQDKLEDIRKKDPNE